MAERATRLLVGEHALERGHLAGERGDIFLRAVDDGKPLVQLFQIVGSMLRGLLQRIAEPVRDRIEPLVDRVLNLRLPIGQHSDHRLKPRRAVTLRLHQFGNDRGLGIGRAAGPPQDDAERHERHDDDGGKPNKQQAVGHAPLAIRRRFGSRFAYGTNSER